MELPKEVFMTIVDLAQIDTDGVRLEYSGRGAYGGTCPGIVVGSEAEFRMFLVEAGRYAAELNEAGWVDCDFFEVQRLARIVRTDNMGKGMIFYFPGLKLT